MRVGYHAPHEQFAPEVLLRLVRAAERAGFDGAMCSDHFNPWSERQDHAGLGWAWLGAALEATGLDFGTVCAPGQRYHPAIVAQAIATLGSMYPGRIWVALASGELLNEHITGEPWPPKAERNQRLLESVEVIRRLLRGDEVTHDGLVRVDRARLYVRPTQAPLLLGAALSEETAAWAGSWADGLAIAASRREAAESLVGAFREGGGTGPVFGQLALGYAADDETATDEAYDRWRHALLDPGRLADLALPREFDQATEGRPREAIRTAVPIASDPLEHVEWLRELEAAGLERVYVHNVARDQEGFIEAYGRTVLPAFRRI